MSDGGGAHIRVWGALLRQHRQQRGWTTVRLGALVGCDPSYITRLERGERGPPALPWLQLLADALALTDPARARFFAAAGAWPDTWDWQERT